MDKKIQFTGGEPDVRQNQLTIDADANRPAMFGMMGSFERITGNYVIYGCVVTVGGSSPSNTWSLTTGYIYLNNELVQVDAQSGTFDSATEFLAFTKDTSYNPLGDKTFLDATPRQTWQVNRGIITVQGSVASNELDAINGSVLKELVLFREDIISASQTSQTVDFSSNEDLILVDVSAAPTGAPEITINNVVNGDTSKFIEVTKTTAQKLVFLNATDITNNPSEVDDTVVTYQIYNKNGSLFVKALIKTISTKVIDIGNWDMDATAGLNIAHSLTLSEIREISVLIRNDTDDTYTPLNYDLGSGASGNYAISATQVNMLRSSGGIFDNTGYDSTSYNRGWITIKYIP